MESFFDVYVENVVPAIDPISDQYVDEGVLVQLPPATFTDPGTLDTHTATIDWGDGTSDTGVVTEPAGGNPGTITGSHVYADDGDYTVTVRVQDDSMAATDPDWWVESFFDVFVEVVLPDTLQVITFTQTSTGFDLDFSRAVDTTTVNLYQGHNTSDQPVDLVVTGPSGSVNGSLIFDETGESASWVVSNARGTGRLPEGDYEVTLFSRPDGWVDTTGELLDGDADGTSGGDYVERFTVASSGERVVYLPDFARGPGQPVNVQATQTGLPIVIDDGSDVYSLSLTLSYDPNDLTLTGGSLIPTGWTGCIDVTTPGTAVLTLIQA